MWIASRNDIDSRDIVRDHLDTLQKVADNAFECEIISIREVHKALNYFYARVNRKAGIALYEKGLARRNPEYLRDGLELLKKNLRGSG